jgi:quinol-cytochrome oxidoreductase complex cytochrome b subunit
MTDEKQDSQIFPADPSKTYGLMELARGTSPLVAKEPEDTVMTFPHLVIIEVLATLTVMVLLLFLSTVRDAPLEEIANPDVSPNPGKAAWYLISAQELILHMHPTLGGVLIPALVIVGLMIIPYVDRSREGIGRWFSSERGKRIALVSALATLVILPTLILLDSHIGDRPAISRMFLPETIPAWATGIVIPLGIMAVLGGLLGLVLWRISVSTREVMIALFTVFVVSVIVLTIIALIFRGPYMHIYWPGRWPEVH